MVRNILFSLIALGTIIGNAFAQSADAGALFGTITESSGAVLPDTSVTITNLATKRTEVEKTNGSGFYSREALPSGDYSISIAHEGFSTVKIDQIHIDPGQRREVSPALAVGGVNSTVTVEASQLQVKTETSENSATVDSKEIQTLLVNGRNFQSLATLVPGVNNTNGNNQYGGGGRALRQRRRRVDARPCVSRATRRRAAAHGPAVAHRSASDNYVVGVSLKT